MADLSQLPFLLKLLDDRSPRVQAKVRGALRSFGPSLRRELTALMARDDFSLNRLQQEALDDFFAELAIEQDDFTTLWGTVQNSADEWFKLETALAFLARWQFELEEISLSENAPLGILLDELAQDYRETELPLEALSLDLWLFGERGLGGAGSDNYYSPLNCNLVHVVQSGAGLPLSLAAIFMLTGYRLGIEVHGCAFPSHFLARSGTLFFDCYNGGRVLEPRESSAILKVMPDAMSPFSAAPIIARMLFNLINAYQHHGAYEKARQCLFLLEKLKYMDTTL